jgi:hypothetical protein
MTIIPDAHIANQNNSYSVHVEQLFAGMVKKLSHAPNVAHQEKSHQYHQ